MENKEGSGVLFRNTQKQSEKSPDYSGSIKINGKDVKFSGWIKQAQSGVKYISLAVNKPMDKKETPKPQNDFIDDNCPF